MPEPKAVTDAIKTKKQTHHDTLYCTPRLKRSLISMMSGSTVYGADTLEIFGLTVIVHERFSPPILCKKGQIFHHVEDWESGDASCVQV